VIPTISTARLTLRPFAESDLDAWAEIVADEETTEYIGGVQSREDAWRSIALFLGHWSLRGFGPWAVEVRGSGRLIGRAGLWCPEGWPELEVGWTLSRDPWGEGYATEAGEAAIEWGFSTLGLDRIGAVIALENARSRAVAIRLGMSLDYETELYTGDSVVVYALNRTAAGPA